MRRVLSALFMAVVAWGAISCDDDDQRVISENALPQAARDFLAEHFTDVALTRIVKDTEGSTEYEVKLANGFQIEFNSAGAWREIEGYGVPVPESILAELPEGIVSYVETNHAASDIIKLEISRGNYEVDLTGNIEIVFSATGAFIRYDD